MAANFIELQEEVSNEDVTNLEQQDSTTSDAESSAQPEQIATEVEMPEKYKNKSLDEIVRMHQEAEKLIGRQAQEVGEVRKLADSLLKQQLEAKHDKQPEQAQEIDWFEDPQKAINQALESNPVLRQLQEQQVVQAQRAALDAIEKNHPDFVSVAQSEDFQQWVGESKVRQRLYNDANNYDVDSALELLNNYKSLRGLRQQKEETSKAADEALKKTDSEGRSKALKAAAVQQGGTGETGKPVYRRADLIRLRMQDPARYESMADEILNAYAEGRVR
jgi:chemotaxis protein histidine kinase CheA